VARGSSRLRQLERWAKRRGSYRQDWREVEEMDRFVVKYGHLPEHDELMLRNEELLTLIDERDYTLEPSQPIPGSEAMGEAWTAFVERCRELEREEQHGQT
jgi:hypothetical protein